MPDLTSDLTSAPTLVLVHAAWTGPWCWDTLRSTLDARGHRTTAPQLPSTDPAGTDSTRSLTETAGLHDDTRALLDHIDRIDGPVTVVAHCYAGFPAAEAAAARPDKITGLVVIAGYVPDNGDSLFGVHGHDLPPRSPGLIAPPVDPIAMFWADVDPAAATAAAARLAPQTLRSFAEPAQLPDVPRRPDLYVLCEKDQAMPVHTQQTFAARCARVVRLRSGHAPFLSQPAVLAEHLEHAAAAAYRTGPALAHV